MAKGRAIAAIMLLTLPMAAPALNSPKMDQDLTDEAPLYYRVGSPETFQDIASKGLAGDDAAHLLAMANGKPLDARLRAGTMVQIPAALLRVEALPARVIGFAGSARMADGTPLALGMTLLKGDIVETGANSHARIEIEGGKRLMLPSRSRIRIDALHRVVLTGRIEQRLSQLEPTEQLAEEGLLRGFAPARADDVNALRVDAPVAVAASLAGDSEELVAGAPPIMVRSVKAARRTGKPRTNRPATPPEVLPDPSAPVALPSPELPLFEDWVQPGTIDVSGATLSG